QGNRGGSFGIGKSVLWRFSMVSTVLFNSTIKQNGKISSRFFGRSLLPFHSALGKHWDGSGWIGKNVKVDGGMRAESLWDEEARVQAQKTALARDSSMQTGTSILVVGFAEPEEEEPRRIE